MSRASFPAVGWHVFIRPFDRKFQPFRGTLLSVTGRNYVFQPFDNPHRTITLRKQHIGIGTWHRINQDGSLYEGTPTQSTPPQKRPGNDWFHVHALGTPTTRPPGNDWGHTHTGESLSTPAWPVAQALKAKEQQLSARVFDVPAVGDYIKVTDPSGLVVTGEVISHLKGLVHVLCSGNVLAFDEALFHQGTWRSIDPDTLIERPPLSKRPQQAKTAPPKPPEPTHPAKVTMTILGQDLSLWQKDGKFIVQALGEPELFVRGSESLHKPEMLQALARTVQSLKRELSGRKP
jgi:hypothetical protein